MLSHSVGVPFFAAERSLDQPIEPDLVKTGVGNGLVKSKRI
jgi:hypothetical protein